MEIKLNLEISINKLEPNSDITFSKLSKKQQKINLFLFSFYEWRSRRLGGFSIKFQQENGFSLHKFWSLADHFVF